MALTIKGIEAAKPKIDKATGKVTPARLLGGGGQYMFPSYGKEGYLNTNALLKAIHTGGYRSREFTLHGLRHMAVTLLKELGFSHDVIYLQLSHPLERDGRPRFTK